MNYYAPWNYIEGSSAPADEWQAFCKWFMDTYHNLPRANGAAWAAWQAAKKEAAEGKV